MKLSLRYSLLVAAILGSAAGCTATLSSTTEVGIQYDAMEELVRAGSALQYTVTRQEESHHFFREKLDIEYSDLMRKIRAVQERAEVVAGPDVVARCAAGEVNEVETTVKDVEEGSPTVDVEIIVAETAKKEPIKKCGSGKPKEGRKEESTDEDICNRDLTTKEAEVVNEDSKAKDGDKEIKDAKADHVHSTSDEADAKESTGTGAPKDNAETREDEKKYTDRVREGSDGKGDLKGDGEVKETKTDDDATEKKSTDEPAGENNSAEKKSKKTKNDKEPVAKEDEHEEKSEKTKKKEKKNGKSRQSDDSEDEASDKGELKADIANEEDALKKPTEDAEKEEVAPVIKSETGESALKQELEAESLDNVVADQDSMASFNKPTTMNMIVGILSLGSLAVLY